MILFSANRFITQQITTSNAHGRSVAVRLALV